MKIGLICPYSIKRAGGVQEYLYAIQKELRRRGHDAYFITPRPEGYDGDPREHMIFLGTSTDFYSPTRTTIQISRGLNDDIQAMLNNYNFDVLNFHEPWIPRLAYQIIKQSGTANVATFHATMPQDMMTKAMAKALIPYTKPILKYFDALVAASEPDTEYVSSLTDKPIRVIPVTVDKEFCPPPIFDDRRTHKTILYINRLEGRKGPKYLLEAFQMLRKHHSEVSLLIAGDGPQRDMLERRARDLGIVDSVTFLGQIPHEQKIQLLQSCDLYCSPAPFGEGFGIVLLEAMATGAVAVAGDNSGYANVMTGFGSISLVNPHDTPDFTRRLELLLYEESLRKLWRTWATTEVKKYNCEKVVDQYLEVYEAAITHHAQTKGTYVEV